MYILSVFAWGCNLSVLSFCFSWHWGWDTTAHVWAAFCVFLSVSQKITSGATC